jgi:hypothetical protein
MRRRELITLLGIAVLWPRGGIAQLSKIPIVGFLTARSRDETADSIAAFREGLREAGQTERERLWQSNSGGQTASMIGFRS